MSIALYKKQKQEQGTFEETQKRNAEQPAGGTEAEGLGRARRPRLGGAGGSGKSGA